MPILDLTLTNPSVKAFMEGHSDIPPVGELLWIHSHFMEDNFLSEIEVMVAMAEQVILENPKKKGIATKLVSLAEKFATQIGTINEQTAPEILMTLREIFRVCTRILHVVNKS